MIIWFLILFFIVLNNIFWWSFFKSYRDTIIKLETEYKRDRRQLEAWLVEALNAYGQHYKKINIEGESGWKHVSFWVKFNR